MSPSTIREQDIRDAVIDMTGSVDIVEAVFTPWDDDQRQELERLLAGMKAMDHLEGAVFGHAA